MLIMWFKQKSTSVKLFIFEQSIKLLSDDDVLLAYEQSAKDAFIASNAPYDKVPTTFFQAHNKWELIEKEVAARGYETLSLDGFLGIGGWYEPNRPELGDKRPESKEPIFYARSHKKRYPDGMRAGHIDQVVHNIVKGYNK